MKGSAFPVRNNLLTSIWPRSPRHRRLEALFRFVFASLWKGEQHLRLETKQFGFVPPAIALAQRQEARFWQLRAAVTLAKYWADQGRRDEGRDLLTPIYAGFTEGFHTADLGAAKILLDGVS